MTEAAAFAAKPYLFSSFAWKGKQKVLRSCKRKANGSLHRVQLTLVSLVLVWLHKISTVLTSAGTRYEAGWVPPPPAGPPSVDAIGVQQQGQSSPIDFASSEDDALGLGTFEPLINESCSYVAFYDIEPHSACLLPNPHIHIRRLGINRREMKLIVSLHNELRSRVAQGLETRGQGGGQPPAAFMMELTWDDELAMVAQGWASQGYDARRLGQEMPKNAHDCNTCRSVNRFEYVGQNVAWASRPRVHEGRFLRSAWAHHIKRLYDEVDFFNPKFVSRFKRGNDGHRVGHYTQIVWGKSSKIGCGAAYYDCLFYSKRRNITEPGQCLKYVCNYGPAGNFVGEPVYATFNHKSRCVVKSAAFPGLCSSAIYNSSFFDIPLLMSTSGNHLPSMSEVHPQAPTTRTKKKRRRRKKKKHTTSRPSSTFGYRVVGNAQISHQSPKSLYAPEGPLDHQRHMMVYDQLANTKPRDSVRVVHTYDRKQDASVG